MTTKRKGYDQEFPMLDRNNSIRSKMSLAESMLKDERIDMHFLDVISTVTMEDLIALKMESSCSNMDNRIYGFPLTSAIYYISLDACAKFAISVSNTARNASAIMGLPLNQWVKLTNLMKVFPRISGGYIGNMQYDKEKPDGKQKGASSK
jgi:hypothetical protein